jgi:hypothetical protein
MKRRKEMIIKPYSYDKAVRRSELYREASERHIWLANQLLKEAIKRSSFSGLYHADIELTLYSSGFFFDSVDQIDVTVRDLREVYHEEGYSIVITEITDGQLKVQGYRLEVNW